MPFTVSDLETVIISRKGRLIDKVGLAGAGKSCFTDSADWASNGGRPYLRDSLVAGASASGLPLADPLVVADADLTALAASALAKFVDFAEVRIAETILGNWVAINVTTGTDREEWEALRKGLQDWLNTRKAELAKLYPSLYNKVRAGKIDLGFSARGCDHRTGW